MIMRKEERKNREESKMMENPETQKEVRKEKIERKRNKE
jgi:hypothetical protein